MKVLLVKMSSLGDIVHTWPAITDLQRCRPDVELHWLVERSYADMAGWHPAVSRTWPVELRLWLRQRNRAAWQTFQAQRRQWQAEHFDRVVDAQGLLKSALIARAVSAHEHHGYAPGSSRERLAGWLTPTGHPVDKTAHAVARTRQLFARVFDYPLHGTLDFGVQHYFADIPVIPQSLLLLPGTSWPNKLWSALHWQRLAQRAVEDGFRVTVVWGSEEERQLAMQLCAVVPGVVMPPQRPSIADVGGLIAASSAVVGLDSGFCHLAAAFGKPVVALFGATSSQQVGMPGVSVCNLQSAMTCSPCNKRYCRYLADPHSSPAPCMESLHPQAVWQQVQALLSAPAA